MRKCEKRWKEAHEESNYAPKHSEKQNMMEVIRERLGKSTQCIDCYVEQLIEDTCGTRANIMCH